MLVIVATGCARHTESEPLPRVVLTASSEAKPAAVDSVRVLGIRPSSVPARGPITIRLRPVTADTSHGPSMFIVDGRTLGLRDDGSIDRVAARRELAQLDPRTISAIQLLKGDSAIRRYGPAGTGGVAIIDIVTHAQRAKTGDP